MAELKRVDGAAPERGGLADATASVVLYRTPVPMLQHLLQSCDAAGFSRGSVVVVDHSPTDALREICSLPMVVYVHRPQNPGFGAGHNLAFRLIADRSSVHFVLNPDISFGEDVIRRIRDFMTAAPGIGLVMPRIVFPDGSAQYLCKLLPTPINLFVRRFLGRTDIARRLDERFELRFFSYREQADIPSLSGCFMALRSSLFEELGGFDDRFFMYMEDVDLSRRIGLRARTVFFPEVQVTHEFARGSYRNLRMTWIHACSAVRYFNKWGWFFDGRRDEVNRRTLSSLGYRQLGPAGA